MKMNDWMRREGLNYHKEQKTPQSLKEPLALEVWTEVRFSHESPL